MHGEHEGFWGILWFGVVPETGLSLLHGPPFWPLHNDGEAILTQEFSAAQSCLDDAAEVRAHGTTDDQLSACFAVPFLSWTASSPASYRLSLPFPFPPASKSQHHRPIGGIFPLSFIIPPSLSLSNTTEHLESVVVVDGGFGSSLVEPRPGHA